ncbi:M24 family metallopeptidase [Mesorhizobium sp. 1B3]|uniref:M24 family metallopeptidase n=1 Tax=Mesorhizobium sp. 1B3 TaxID=3243599 RepID=UPI003D97ECAF
MRFKPNSEALRKLASQEGLEAIVAMSPENFTYASGAFVLTVKMIRPRQAFAVLPAKSDPFVIVCSIEESLTRDESWIDDIRTYTEFVDVPVDVLADHLKEAGISSGRVGIDLAYLPVTSSERLKERLPGVTWVDTTDVIAAVRSVKGADEIAILEKATKATHQATLDAMAASKLGDSEFAMAKRIANNIIDYGADGTLFMCFGSGERSLQPHAIARDDVIPQPGDIIRFDVGGTYGAFASDFARTYSAGEPTDLQLQIYSALIAIETAVIDAVAPGVLAEDLFYLCRDEFKKHGVAFHMPHIGHSFGVELHEDPMLRPGVKTPLRPGMVINIEPVAKDGQGGLYHTEDLVVVTENGFRLLTLGLAPKELPVIGQKIR